ncbi:VOC family protein [Undibacterium sp. TJN25]|uniref:VOC family protein n=1 Tax=Undibacterium sp. TJN25 TaxID=3413056 RepID=UPI003BF1DD52
MANVKNVDHVGIRVSDKEAALRFYQMFGFEVDPQEDDAEVKAVGMVNDSGARIHLIYNSSGPHAEGNVLLDHAVKWPGYTHTAFIVEDLDEILALLERENIRITEGPLILGHGRRRAIFFRDPDLNVVEFNEILA